MGWIKIESIDDVPKQYTDVLVLFGKRPGQEIKVMRHESGWWYGLAKGAQPVAYYSDDELSEKLNIARIELLESDL